MNLTKMRHQQRRALHPWVERGLRDFAFLSVAAQRTGWGRPPQPRPRSVTDDDNGEGAT